MIKVVAILERDGGKELVVSGILEDENVHLTEQVARQLYKIIDDEIMEPERFMVSEALDSAVWGD